MNKKKIKSCCVLFIRFIFFGKEFKKENTYFLILGFGRGIAFFAALGFICWSVFNDQNYFKYGYAKGYTTVAISGVARTLNGSRPYNDERIFDVTDVSAATVEDDSYFVITNLIITEGQTYGKCEEDNAIPGSNCTLANICERGKPLKKGNGFMTGTCIDSERYEGEKSCEVYAWCPTEDLRLQPPNPPVLSDVSNFSVSIRNHVEFPRFNFKRDNSFKIESEDELDNCRYDEEENKHCPNFVIKDILTYAGISSISDIAVSGGYILVTITWNCNMLDTDGCIPQYSFRRISQRLDGIFYRFARYYEHDTSGVDRRRLFKAFGIRFLFQTEGEAYQFKLLKLLLTLGGSFGVMGLINGSFSTFAIIVDYCTNQESDESVTEKTDKRKEHNSGTMVTQSFSDLAKEPEL